MSNHNTIPRELMSVLFACKEFWDAHVPDGRVRMDALKELVLASEELANIAEDGYDDPSLSPDTWEELLANAGLRVREALKPFRYVEGM